MTSIMMMNVTSMMPTNDAPESPSHLMPVKESDSSVSTQDLVCFNAPNKLSESYSSIEDKKPLSHSQQYQFICENCDSVQKYGRPRRSNGQIVCNAVSLTIDPSYYYPKL